MMLPGPFEPAIQPIVDRVLLERIGRAGPSSLLVAVSGIDASGKGYCTRLIVEELIARGIRAVGIGLDPWYHLPEVRFGVESPGQHFYRHGFRFDELFDQLILPLKRSRSIQLDARHVYEHSTDYETYRYDFANVDVIVLEGIFLLQAAFLGHFDLTVWVECSYETALERAIVRGQEGLPPDETTRAFETIYFPAERHHLAVDNPKAAADLILINDPRLARST
jgi:uridine kinase